MTPKKYPREHDSLFEYIAWDLIIPISMMVIYFALTFNVIAASGLLCQDKEWMRVLVVLFICGTIGLLALITADIIKYLWEKRNAIFGKRNEDHR